MVSSLSLVGTTSGGKSTIGNLLSGRYILPAGVQETTTSVIEICHDIHAHTPRLTFTDTKKNLRYETRFLVDDAEIRSCIEGEMSLVDSPIAHIGLRLSLRVKDPSLFRQLNDLLLRFVVGGPPVLEEMRVTHGFVIRDFPGFRHQQDEHRLRMIEEYFDDQGMTIYTFNAEEIDHTKEDQLLAALFALLRCRGRDWRSIIFVLNRKDAFYRDLDPAHSLRSALAARQARIKRFIAATWDQAPEPTIEIIPLAAGPVFASEMLCWHDTRLASADREFLEYQVENMAFPLLPVDLQDVLPRSPSRWTYSQWLLVYKAMRTVSGLNALVKALSAQARSLRFAATIAPAK
jgi:hypothetical protein